MPISLNNSKDIVANSVSIIRGNRTIDLVETIDAVQGFAPSTLNSLEKLATAMNNDPAFFTTLSTSIGNKADKSTTYTKTSMDAFLNAKVDDTEMTDDALKTYVTTAVGTKQATLTTGTAVTNSQAILSGSIIKTIVPGTGISLSSDANGIIVTGTDAYDKSNIDGKITTINTNVAAKQATLSNGTEVTNSKTLLFGNIIKNILPGTNMSFSSDDNKITINGIDAYTKEEITSKFNALVNSAPGLLGTLGEIAAYLGNPTNTSTNLISLISTKANSTDTFAKSKIDTDYYLGGLGNKRFTSLGTTENKLIFEIQDTMGTSFNDAYYPAITFQMNTTTKQISCYIPNSLFINNVNVMDQIALKVNTTDLSNYALNTSLSSYIKLDFNQLLVPSIILTSTNVGPPITLTNSVGSRLVLYNLQNTNTAYTNIAIGVDAGSYRWFGIDGASTNAPLSLGGWRFYQNTNIVATIKSNGDFICKNINCDGLMIGSTNVLI